MSLQLYNTLKGEKEAFTPLSPPHVGLYTCGPTVYNYAHIGNLRAYVFADVLRRTLEYSGYKVKQVMNITDVGQLTSDADEGEDKMVKALKRAGKPLTLEAMREVADRYTAAFLEDLHSLNIKPPSVMPRASEHIKEDMELVQKLLEKGIAYKTSDGIYFDVSKFPAYGTRGGFKLGELKEGARVAVNVEKRNPRDFALWKFSTTDLGFDFPSHGKGSPGWHVECSAMSRKYLGQPFDIHTGGIDHIPVHHQNEIAQSEAAYDAPLAHFWMHNEYLNFGADKMSKSGEIFITLQTLKDRGIHPLACRYYLLQAHYRSPIQFSWKALETAQSAYFKLLFQFTHLPNEGMVSIPLTTEVKHRISDDLNTARLLALLQSEFEEFAGSFSRNTVKDVDKILGLDIENQSRKLAEEMNTVPDSIKQLAAAREDARQQKDFVKADALRSDIQSAGFNIMDTGSGPIVRKHIR